MRTLLTVVASLWLLTGCAANVKPMPELPAAVSGERREIDSAAGRLSYYAAAPQQKSDQRPLLLIHSMNASGSAYEMRPIHEHCREQRPVYTVDLPGFGFSERSDRVYSPRLMTDAVLAMVDEIRKIHGPGAIDAAALSLSAEFLARAAVERPDAFARLALISPTGLSGKKKRLGPAGASRGQGWLYKTFTWSGWDDGVYGLLTRPGTIRYFLERTWGGKNIDEGLWAYDVLSTQQPGAKHAPFYFVSAFLFSADVNALYDQLRMPVWVSHGVKGDFVDYRGQVWYEDQPNWQFTVFQTGALPQFEAEDAFLTAFDRFLAGERP